MRNEDKNKSKNSFSGNTSNITIHSCAESGDLSGLVRVLVSNPLLINEKSILYDETPLHFASKNWCVKSARMLLDHGANVHARTNNQIAPLHLAVGFALRSGDNSIVKLLLEFNANCSAADDEGMLAFNYIPTTGYEHEELCQLVNPWDRAATTITAITTTMITTTLPTHGARIKMSKNQGIIRMIVME